MCLAIPGKILSIDGDALARTGKVSFGGSIKGINLALVPEAEVDDYVIVHAGVAINRLDEAEAAEVFTYLRDIAAAEEAAE